MIYRKGKGLHTVTREAADGYLQGIELCRKLKRMRCVDAGMGKDNAPDDWLTYSLSDGTLVYERTREGGKPYVYRILTYELTAISLS